MNHIVSKLRQAWTWLESKLGFAAVLIVTLIARTFGVLAVLVLLLVCAEQAKADDATMLELMKQQARINALFNQRLDAAERRLALLEQKVQTAYSPGSMPPASASKPPSYTPSYTPPSSTPDWVAPCPSCTSSSSDGSGLPEYARRAIREGAK